MPRVTRHVPRNRALRVLIVDGHEISRAAQAALLRTEGLEVLDIHPDRDAVAVARALQPQVVVIDAGASATGVAMLVRALRALPRAPWVVLTSSGDPGRLDRALAELTFVAKADICAAAIQPALVPGTDELRQPCRSE
jgi:DNA-binding NarL/FixJ family response regulator